MSVSIFVSVMMTYLTVFSHGHGEKVKNVILCFIAPQFLVGIIWFLIRYLNNPLFLNEILYLRNAMVSSETYLQGFLSSLISASGRGLVSFSNLSDILLIAVTLILSFSMIRKISGSERLILTMYVFIVSMYFILARFNGWYYVYFVPFSFLASSIIISHKNNSTAKKVFLTLFVVIVVGNLLKFAVFSNYVMHEEYDFPAYAKSIASDISGEANVLAYHDIVPFVGSGLASTRDLEYAMVQGNLSFEDYIQTYNIGYVVHDNYMEYLLDSGILERHDFNNYLEAHAEIVSEYMHPHFGFVEEGSDSRILKVYRIK